MFDASIELLIILFLVSAVAGWVDAIAGGGGLITIPALLLTGISPAAALATNKLQGCFGALTAATYFIRRGAVSLRENVTAIALVCLGSTFGGITLTKIDASILSVFVPFLLVLIGLYFLFFAGDLDDQRAPRLTRRQFNLTAAPGLGFYDGFFGPGTGSFMAISLVTLRGFDIRNATAHAKLFNFASNLSALGYFIFFGQIAWILGGVMILGQVLGAYMGAHFALKIGAKIIRPVTIIVCFAMSFRLLWSLFEV